RRRLALEPWTLRAVALNFMDDSKQSGNGEVAGYVARRATCAPRCLPICRDQQAGKFGYMGWRRPAQSTNSELTDSALEMRRMVSPSSAAHESWRILPQAWPCSDSGMVSVTTSSSSEEVSMRSMAPPDSTGCVQYAYTAPAPRSFRAWAALHSVPAVSTMSSMMMQVRPSTSPMTFMTSDTLARGRREAVMDWPASSCLASARARTTPPMSGDTTTRFEKLRRQMSPSRIGPA